MGVGGHYLVKVYKWNGTIGDQTIANNWIKTGEISTLAQQVAAVYLNENGTVLLVITYETASGGPGLLSFSFFYKAYNFNGTTWQQMGSTVTASTTVNAFDPPSPEGHVLNREGNIFYVRNDTGVANRSIRAYKWNGTNWVMMGTQITANYFGFTIFLNEAGSKVTVSRDPNNNLPIEQYQYIP